MHQVDTTALISELLSDSLKLPLFSDKVGWWDYECGSCDPINQCPDKWRLSDELNWLAASPSFNSCRCREEHHLHGRGIGRTVLWCSTFPPPRPSQPGCTRWAAPAKCPGRPPVVQKKKIKKKKAPPHPFPSQSRSLLGRSALFHASDVSSFVVGAKGEVPRGVDPQ